MPKKKMESWNKLCIWQDFESMLPFSKSVTPKAKSILLLTEYDESALANNNGSVTTKEFPHCLNCCMYLFFPDKPHITID